MEKNLRNNEYGGWKCACRVDFFFEISKHDFTFIGEMRVSRHESTNFSFMNKMRVFPNKDKYWNSLVR